MIQAVGKGRSHILKWCREFGSQLEREGQGRVFIGKDSIGRADPSQICPAFKVEVIDRGAAAECDRAVHVELVEGEIRVGDGERRTCGSSELQGRHLALAAESCSAVDPDCSGERVREIGKEAHD